MRSRFCLVVAFSLAASTAQGGVLSDCGLHKNDCRGLIGKRLWVVVPQSNPNTVEVSPTPNEYSNTQKMRAGSFLVKDVISNATFGKNFVVTLSNGKTGYVWDMAWIFLSETDPAEDARKQADAQKARREECERRGQPKIGMSQAEAVVTCWGKPVQIVKTTTAVGIQEDYRYGRGHLLRFENGALAAILETR